jgi:hypothetical protein
MPHKLIEFKPLLVGPFVSVSNRLGSCTSGASFRSVMVLTQAPFRVSTQPDHTKIRSLNQPHGDYITLCSSFSSTGSLNVKWTSADRAYFDGKGIQFFFAILLNVHADVRVSVQEGWHILGVYSQLAFAVFSEVAVPLRDDMCMCGNCESLVG